MEEIKKDNAAVNVGAPAEQSTPAVKKKIAKKGILKTTEMPLYKSAASANVSTAPSFWYQPELTPESWLLPKSRQEILRWCRIYYNLEPYIYSIVNMLSAYPFSKFDIICQDKKLETFYKNMAFNKKFNLYKFLLQASLSRQKFGESIHFGTLEQDELNRWRWARFILLEPELVEIKSSTFEDEVIFELIPTSELKALIQSQDPMLENRKKAVPKVVTDCIMAGKNIPLDAECVSYIANITDPSAVRGTSPIQALFKVLIYQDKLRLSQIAILDRYRLPYELWTYGDLEKDIIPDPESLENVRQMILQAIQSPPFVMVFPPIIKYEALSVSGKLLPLTDDLNYLQDQILVGMGCNKNIILGEGSAFSNVKAIALHRLIMTLQSVRDDYEDWMKNVFFGTVAEKNGWFEYVNGEKRPAVPQISWHRSLDIENEEKERDEYTKMHQGGFISTKTMYSKYPNLNFDNERKLLEEEAGTIFDKGSTNERIPQKFIEPGGAVAPSAGSVAGASTPEAGLGTEIPSAVGEVGAPMNLPPSAGTEVGATSVAPTAPSEPTAPTEPKVPEKPAEEK